MEKIKTIELGKQYANLSIAVSILILLVIIIQIVLYLIFEYNAMQFTLPAISILPVILIFGSINFKKIINKT